MQPQPFDPAPLMEVLTKESTPSEMARNLNEIHNQLADYMILEEEGGLHAVSLLHCLRRLRDSIMMGAGYFDFNKP